MLVWTKAQKRLLKQGSRLYTFLMQRPGLQRPLESERVSDASAPASMSAPSGQPKLLLSKFALTVAGATAFTILFLVYAAMAKLLVLHPDQAHPSLYAQAILDGNVFLRGWELTTVTFYTEIPLYMIAIKLIGLNADLMRVVPAFIHTVNIFLLGGLIWKYRTREGIWMFLPFVILAVMPAGGLWTYGLFGPMHHVTTSCGFLVLMLLNRDLALDRFSRTSLAVAGVGLVGTWGDLAFLFVFAMPVAFACLYAHRDHPDLQSRAGLLVALPLLMGSVVGQLIVMGMRSLGLGTPGGLEHNMFVRSNEVLGKVFATLEGWMELFFPSVWGRPGNLATMAALMLALGFWWWLRAMYWAVLSRRAAAIDVLCAVMPIAVFAMVVATKRQGWVNEVRMLIPAYLMGVFLVCRWWQDQPNPRRNAWALVLMGIGAVILTFNFFRFNNVVADDASAGRYRRMAVFLEQRGLTKGHADYWSAPLVMVASGNRVRLSPLLDSGDVLSPYYWGSSIQSYVGWRSRFMLIRGQSDNPDEGPHSRLAHERAATQYWGEPKERYEVEGMVVLVWDKDKEVRPHDYPPNLVRRIKLGL